MAEIFLLAVGAMFWPLLLAADIVAFKATRPAAVLAWFLAGGFLTTVSIGIAIVVALRQSSYVSRSRHTTDAWVDITIGALAVCAAIALRRRGPRERDDTASSGRLGRLLTRGAPLAFVAGIIVNVVPGVLPFIALKDIAELGYSDAATVAVIAGFYVVMFTFVEAPLLGFAFAPARTTAAVTSFDLWLDRNLYVLASWVLAVAGVLEIGRGIVAAV
ncbi:MAG TPA: GAP family protein [Gaiellaceae bacterium]